MRDKHDDLPALRDNADNLLSTIQVAELVGLTYRQIDYLTHQTRVRDSLDPHHRRGYPADVVHRIQVAVALNNVIHNLGNRKVSLLPSIAEMVFDAEPPLAYGWAGLDQASVVYAHRPGALFPATMDEIGLIVVKVPELWRWPDE